jgi:pyroglutamyl-peptidase
MGLDGTLLLTGFEPFGGDARNPSAELAQWFHGERIGGLLVVSECLPCVFSTAPRVLEAAIERCRPVMVLALGQAAGRAELSLERVAINLMDAPIADNAGDQPINCAIDPAGPAAYFSDLPIPAMVAAARAAGVPAGTSLSAGSFVCNQVFYCLRHRVAKGRLPVPAGFMHLPLLPEQAAARMRRDGSGLPLPSLPFEAMRQGLRAALGAAAEALQGVHEQPNAARVGGPQGDTGRLH